MTVRDFGEAWDANKRLIIPIGSLAVIVGVVVFCTQFYMTVLQMAEDISEIKEANKTYVTESQLEDRLLLHNLRYHQDEGPDQ